MPDVLHIQLLGGFHLDYEGRSILATESANGQSLVVFLLLQRGAPQPRQRLAFQLWPDSGETQALSNLRALLVRLRRAWPEIEQYVEIGPRALRWREDSDLRFDVADFEDRLRRAEQEPEQREAALEQAVGLYRGDLFPNCYQDWILPERERLRQEYLQALEALIASLTAHGQYSAAIGYAQRRLQSDPLDETTYQTLLRLHAQRGDRASLLRVFDTCTTVLQRELAVEPSASTQELFEQLRRRPPISAPTSPAPISAPHNLPHPLTSFVGRQREMIEISHRLQTARLLTLTSAGGSGKTRLALQVAFEVYANYHEGAWWVDLAPLADAGLVSQVVAKTLEVQEQAGRPLIETLASAIGTRQGLLILDNCEHHVAECASLIKYLLSACPQLTVLATSRESLGLGGEVIYAVLPLSLPAEGDRAGIAQSEAVRLFVERAALTLPTFALTPTNGEAVAQVCRRLDGIPLAIELAAARVKMLSVDQIAARLDDRFSLLTKGDRAALPRHQTLRAMVDWSHALLSHAQQALFRRLAVFADGFTLEAAEAVGGVADSSGLTLETLSHLIDKSLVIAEEAPGVVMRYRLLETLRQYAREKLDAAAETPLLGQRHADFFAQLAAEAHPHLQRPSQRAWLDRLASDYGNLRAALGWFIEGRQTEAALRLSGCLGWFWVDRSEYAEGRHWLERALALPDVRQYPSANARVLVFVGLLAFFQTEEQEAKPWLEQGLALARAHAERPTAGLALDFLGLIAIREQNIAGARACLEESQALFAQAGDEMGYAITVWHLGYVAERERDTATALNRFAQALARFQEWGDVLRQSAVLRSIGWNHFELGDRVRGRTALRESLALAQAIRTKGGIAHTLRAIVERIEGDPEQAVRLLMVVVNLYHSLGSTTYEQAVLEKDVAQRRAQLDEATFARACEAGRALTVEQAVQEALLVE